MNRLQVMSLLAGLFFGLWPLLMSRSGLSGNVSSMAFAGLVFIFVTPFAIGNIASIDASSVKWTLVVGAGLLGAVGVMCFNGMLAGAERKDLGTLFVLMIVVQTAVPTVYDAIINRGMSPTKGAGVLLAAIAAVLLCKE